MPKLRLLINSARTKLLPRRCSTLGSIEELHQQYFYEETVIFDETSEPSSTCLIRNSECSTSIKLEFDATPAAVSSVTFFELKTFERKRRQIGQKSRELFKVPTWPTTTSQQVRPNSSFVITAIRSSNLSDASYL